MKGYIEKLLKYGHAKHMHPQITPHKHRKIKYGSKQKLIPEDNTSPDLDTAVVKRIQSIIGDIFYYERAVNNKILVALSAIGSQ